MEATNDKTYIDENGVRVVPASAIKKVEPNPTIYLADESKIKGSAAYNAEANVLWIWIDGESGETLASAFTKFNNTVLTATIKTTYLDTDEPKVYEGFTRLTDIKVDYSNKISIRMAKPI